MVPSSEKPNQHFQPGQKIAHYMKITVTIITSNYPTHIPDKL